MADYKTPGVYIEEISQLAPSAAEVPTAIPAFIGYTETAKKDGTVVLNKPVYVNSLLEYKNIFGGSVESRYGEIKEREIKHYFNDFENPSENWMLFYVVE